MPPDGTPREVNAVVAQARLCWGACEGESPPRVGLASRRTRGKQSATACWFGMLMLILTLAPAPLPAGPRPVYAWPIGRLSQGSPTALAGCWSGCARVRTEPCNASTLWRPLSPTLSSPAARCAPSTQRHAPLVRFEHRLVRQSCLVVRLDSRRRLAPGAPNPWDLSATSLPTAVSGWRPSTSSVVRPVASSTSIHRMCLFSTQRSVGPVMSGR